MQQAWEPVFHSHGIKDPPQVAQFPQQLAPLMTFTLVSDLPLFRREMVADYWHRADASTSAGMDSTTIA